MQELKSRKLMIDDMHTDLVGDTQCITHNFGEVLSFAYDVGYVREQVCGNCGSIKPLDPIDNHTYEVD